MKEIKVLVADDFLKDAMIKWIEKTKINWSPKFLEKSTRAKAELLINGFETETMLEFAKLHVKAAKKEIYKNIKLKPINSTEVLAKIAVGRNLQLEDMEIDKDSILNSYPLTNIK